MSNIKHYRLGAIIRVGTKYLLVRARNSDSSPTSGFHLPGRPMTEFKPQRVLKKFFLDYYDADVDVRGGLEPIIKDGDSLSAFLVDEISPLCFPSDHFEYGFYSLSDLETMDVEPADKIAIEKADCFLPLLRSEKRVSALTPMEIDKINRMLDALRYFHHKIPHEEVKQFRALADTEISYEGLLRAFRFVLKQYECNFYKFLDRKSNDPFDV